MKMKRLPDYSDKNIITELRKTAQELNKKYLTRKDIDQYSRINSSTLNRHFGNFEKALELAGLNSSRHFKYTEEDLLNEIDKIWLKLGRQPTCKEIRNIGGKFSSNTYLRHFGSWIKAIEAYINWKNKSNIKMDKNVIISFQNQKSIKLKKSKCLEYGEPIDFLGLRHAPINEQGVVYLFGVLSKRLGFTVEAIRSDFPDCEAKREIPNRKGRWERVSIEFEFKSSNFVDHNHDPNECDIIVCWEHDWSECPIQVISLKEIMEKFTSS